VAAVSGPVPAGPPLPGVRVGADEYTERDLSSTIAPLGEWWRQVTDDRLDLVADLVARQDAAFDEFAPDSALGSLDERAAAVQRLLVGSRRRDADPDVRRSLRSQAERLVDTSLALIAEAGRRMRPGMALLGPSVGSVAQLNVSAGGVPKTPVPSIHVGRRGLEGDVQHVRMHHGRAWQALCLWSSEVIARLQAEGHPIAAGSAGENVTIAGLDWRDVRTGVQIRMGEVLCEVSLYALPCASNAAWFLGRRFDRMHHLTEDGVSRVYASVLETGRISVGDSVTIVP
jgi:MOSC domain-containing protein YiiM